MSGRIAGRAVGAAAAMVVLAVAVAAVDQLFGWRVADREASDTGHEPARHDSWRDSTVGREKALSRRGFAAPPVPPIHVSPDRRHILDGDGVPLLVHGDTPWSLAVQLTRPQVRTYLRQRLSLGLNAIMFNLIEHRYGDANPHPWTNQYGDPPFTGETRDGFLDFTAPDQEYWSQIDWIISEADACGMLCFLVPAYVGFGHNSAGWARELKANGVEGARAYGEFLGRRYGAKGNVIWVMGGDWGPVSDHHDLTQEVNALAGAIAATAPEQLITAHANRNDSALDDYPEPWLDLNSTYAEPGTVVSEVANDCPPQNPILPTFLIEGRYENEDVPARDLRAQMYQAILGGAQGHLYGASNVWYFDADSGERFADDPADTWQEALEYPGARSLAALSSLLRVRDLAAMIPDHDGRLLTALSGEPSHVPCRLSADQEVAVSYVPRAGALSLDRDRMAAGSLRVSWYDPSRGEVRGSGVVDSRGPVTLSPPGPGDWILLLDRSERELRLPDGRPLAVALESFSASRDADDVLLEWRARSSGGDREIVLQRQVDRVPFTEIGRFAVEEDQAGLMVHQHLDAAIPTRCARVRYRLQLIDGDEKARYSETLTLKLKLSGPD